MKYTWCGMVMLLPLAGITLAADTGIEGSITQSLSYDDNFLFRDNAESTFIYNLTPQLTAYYRTQTYTSALTGGVDFLRHSDFSDYDRTNPRLNWQQNWLRIRSSYGLGVSYQERDQRSEAADDLGDFTTRSKVKTFSVAPSFQHQLSQRDTLTLSANYTDRRYSGSTSSNDNQSLSLNGGWSHRLSERLALRGNLGYTRYESDGQVQDTQSDIWRANAGVDYDWSERTSLTLLLGATHQKTQDTRNVLFIDELGFLRIRPETDTSTQTGSSVTMQWSHRSLLNGYSISYTRDFVPSSDGEIREQDRLNFGFTRSLSELSQMSVNATWLQSSDENTSRDYFSITPSYSRDFSRDWSMNAQYEFRWQKRSNEDSSIDASLFRVSLVYSF